MNILVVEDHPDLAANVGDFLGAQGHGVEFAADGKQGLKLAQSRAYDAIILDRMLPGMDGLSLCRQLRTAPGATPPILMLTAMDAVGDRVDGLRAGADDYLVKPFALTELLARLEALHRRAGGASETRQLRVEDLSFDLDTLEVRRAGDLIALTPAARKLLDLLMRQTHRVVTREELEQRLWGDETPEADVLRAHMYALRAGIDRPYAKKLLHTVHGTGYRLAAIEH